MFKLTEEQYIQMNEEFGGFCISCKEEAYGVGPDARKYECESCGLPCVYGLEELLVMGYVDIVNSEKSVELD